MRCRIDLILDLETCYTTNNTKTFCLTQIYKNIKIDYTNTDHNQIQTLSSHAYLIGLYDGPKNIFYHFKSVKEFWLEIMNISYKKDVHIWCHNLSYDFEYLRDGIDDDFGIKIEKQIGRQQKIIFCKVYLQIRNSYKCIHFWDTTNILKIKLSEIWSNNNFIKKGSLDYLKVNCEWNSEQNGWNYYNWLEEKEKFESFNDTIDYLQTDLKLTYQILSSYLCFLDILSSYFGSKFKEFRFKNNKYLNYKKIWIWILKNHTRLAIDKNANSFKKAFKTLVGRIEYQLQQNSNVGGFFLTALPGIYKKEKSIWKIDINSYYAHLMEKELIMGKYSLNKPIFDNYKTFLLIKYKNFSCTNKYFNNLLKANYFIGENKGPGEYLILKEYSEMLEKIGNFEYEIIETRYYGKINGLSNFLNYMYDYRNKTEDKNLQKIIKFFLHRGYGILCERTYFDKEVYTQDINDEEYIHEQQVEENVRCRSIIGGIYIQQIGRLNLIKDIIKLTKYKDFQLFYANTDCLIFAIHGDEWKKEFKFNCLGGYKIDAEKHDVCIISGVNQYLTYKNNKEYTFGYSAGGRNLNLNEFIEKNTFETVESFFNPKNSITTIYPIVKMDINTHKKIFSIAISKREGDKKGTHFIYDTYTKEYYALWRI